MDLWKLALVAYSIWGFYCGLRFVENRWPSLQKPHMKIIKWIVSFYVGLIIGMFKLIEHIFKLVGLW